MPTEVIDGLTDFSKSLHPFSWPESPFLEQRAGRLLSTIKAFDDPANDKDLTS
jgi:hypothetical protein